MDKLTSNQISFHHNKIVILKRELVLRKQNGERKIWKSQMELESELARIQNQIDSHKEKIKALEATES